MKSYDYVIVGAGSAGCVLANRLSADGGGSVLLLEAGGRDRNPLLHMPLAFRYVWPDPRWGWGYASEPEPHLGGRRIEIPRGRVLGGCSSINAMIYARGHRDDYDQWRQMGLDGWGYADVLPYFKRAECNWRGEGAYHGGSGPLKVGRPRDGSPFFDLFMAAAAAAGHAATDDVNGAAPEGFGAPDLTIGGGRRSSTATAYLRPAAARPTLAVETRAHATAVVIEAGRAVGVDYRRGGRACRVRADREVVLCGGAYNSPQLLLLSGIGPADELRRHGIDPVLDRPAVGRNLQDHVNTALTFAAGAPLSFDPELRLDRLALSVLRWALSGAGPAAGLPLSCIGFVRTRPELARPDVEYLVSPVAPDAHVWFPLIRRPRGHRFGCRIACLHPESVGRVSLRSADPAAAPRILYNLLEADADVACLRAGIKAMREIFAQAPLARVTESELTPGPGVRSDDEIDAFLRAAVATAHHPAGTCRMGSDDDAVVDGELRVRGIDGLRVADASIMPTVPGGNTNAPAIMIAEKAADMILGRDPPPRDPV